MGQKTEELMTACRKATDTFKPLLTTIESKVGKLTKEVSGLKKKAVPPKDEQFLRKDDAQQWQTELEGLKTNRLDLAKHLDLLRTRALRDAAKAAGDLKSKVGSKDFLNFFKDQRSLDEAKKLLKQTQEAIERTEEQLTAFNSTYSALDSQFDTMTDLFKLALKNGVDDKQEEACSATLQRFLTKSLPNALTMMKSAQALCEKKEGQVKKLQDAVKNTRTWTPQARDTRGAEITQEIQSLTKLIESLPTLIANGQVDWDPLRARYPKNVLALAAIKKLIKQAEAGEALAMKTGDGTLTRLEALRTELDELQKDVSAAGNDDNTEAIEEGLRNLDSFLMVIKEAPTGRGQAHIDDGKRDLQFLVALAKKAPNLTEDEQKRLSAIRNNYGPVGQMGTQQWANSLSRTNRSVEGLVKRFKQEPRIQAAYKEFKTEFQAAKKLTDTYIKLELELAKRADKLVEALP